eukprot:CAMPEP_0168858514 /NCGR_PEP_ID=MMETSP0727-20121128/16329_1 /TAXON_ID=265536 /ORGANISM="Amphiprora sp., Strain CCMP467" /LENGTH=280 /DNA_ID=CAMNT_0008913265 /DNA_START=41 /DNA_END=882 /DNA_ORIENTATION=-
MTRASLTWLLLAAACGSLLEGVSCFAPKPLTHVTLQRARPSDLAITALRSTSNAASTSPRPKSAVDAASQSAAKSLRKGPYFDMDRGSGQIEFGATARLVTELDQSNEDRSELIKDWLRDTESFAMSIWQEDLIEKRSDNVYRLQLMTLNFVTIELAPWVDLQMKTVEDSEGNPVFTLQSAGFDPNVQMAGLRFSAESLGIVIEVAGQLRASPNGNGVTGSIAFQTTGNLPGPLRILPKAALKAASDTINETVVNFAVKSFQTGAISNYQKYLQKRQLVS